ncbi:hydrolase [Foetidibacter luteolus]|uniref:hydrolase n=1 Tax=Foetidibacter luteolus TaxID=2608880 RepID=UPI00129BD0A4|nr:hydrolase [Foetidibacter luteolus]
MAFKFPAETVLGNNANKGNSLSRSEAEQLFTGWVLNPRLQLHMRQVAYLMKCWAAEKEGAGEQLQWQWEMAGLLHDADWDQWPDEHCKKIVDELDSRHVDPAVLQAIASHGPAYFGIQPQSNMDKMLYAFDELSGLVHAYALMRPNGYEGMDVKGVKKRLKEKSFAANVSRDDIKDACNRAGLELDELITFIIPRQALVTARITAAAQQ